MGKGQRHSKNAGVMGSEGLTYREKQALGFGTVKERLGKDAQGNFSDCCLTLQPAIEPMCCPRGHLFSKEAILECLLSQSKSIKQQMQAFKSQEQQSQREQHEKEYVRQQAEVLAFDRYNHQGASDRIAGQIVEALNERADRMHDQKMVSSVVNIQENKERMKELKAFWLPSQAPSATEKLKRPNKYTVCPIDGQKLKAKDLIRVRFTQIEEDSGILYIDPISRDTFSNSSRIVIIKPTGTAMFKETYEKCVKPEGEYEGIPVKETDIIQLQGGGTGYAARDGDTTQGNKFYYLGPGNGLTDLRGQWKGPHSHGGLIFMN